MTERNLTQGTISIDKMINAGEAFVLPCDVTVGHTVIRAGCTVGTVLRSIKVHAEAIKATAYQSDATPEQVAAYHGDIDGDSDC